MNTLIIAATLVCQLNTVNFTENEQLNCIDFIVNCAIDKKGKTTESKVEECASRFQNGERYKGEG